jgi:alkylation response protein AidB-like acyl-CoA dehydrogenase
MFEELLATAPGGAKSIPGEKFGCIGLGPLQITQRSGDWLLNGTAKLVTNASSFEHMIAFAEPLSRGTAPPRAFLLSLTGAGVSKSSVAGPVVSTVSLASAPALLAFGDDETVARFVSTARLGVAAVAVGLARRVLANTVRSIKERDRGVEPGPTGQASQFALSDMATEIDAAWVVTLDAGSRRDAGASFETLAAEAKVLACPTARRVVEKATQVAGASAAARELDQAAATAQLLSRAYTTDAQDISTIASDLLEES